MLFDEGADEGGGEGGLGRQEGRARGSDGSGGAPRRDRAGRACPPHRLRVVRSQPVGVIAAVSTGVHVDGDDAEARQRMEELVADLLSDLMTCARRQGLVNGRVELGPELMPQPADAHIVDVLDAGDRRP